MASPRQQHSPVARGIVAALLIAVVTFSGFRIWQVVKEAPAQRHIENATRLLQQGKSDDAEFELRQAVQVAPNNVAAWELLSDWYWQKKEYAQAEPALERLLQLEPDAPEANVRLATCLLEGGDKTGARRSAEAQLKLTPTNLAALQMLADLDKEVGQSSDRIQRLQQLVQLQPQNVSFLRQLVDEQEAQGNFEQALPLADRLVKIAPNVPTSFYLRGKALYTVNADAQMLERAKADFEKILQLSPNDSEGHRFLGRIYMRLNQPRKAVAELEQVGRGRPFATAHYLELASAYRRVGNSQKADELQGLFTRIKGFNSRLEDGREQLHVAPDSKEALLNMAKLVYDSTRGENAFYELARYRLLQGRLQSASFYLHKALKETPQDAQSLALQRQVDAQTSAFCTKALNQLKTGDVAGAKASLFRALLLRPESPDTQKALKVFTAQNVDPLGTLPPPPASIEGLVSPTK